MALFSSTISNPIQITKYGHQNHRMFIVCSQHKEINDSTKLVKQSNEIIHWTKSLSHLLHLHIDTPPRANLVIHNHKDSSLPFHFDEKHSTPTSSPKEVISHKWHEVQGSSNWDNLLDPLDPSLRREIIKYGEFAQATYDAFDFNPYSDYCGSCRYNKSNIFDKLGLRGNGYNGTNYIYAMSHVNIPRWLERSHLLGTTWSKDSNWMGYVAVSDDEETRRIGRRDILVAWRGTVAPSEWCEDFQRDLKPYGKGHAMVEHGFLSIYTSKSESTRYTKASASEQTMRELKKLVKFYKDRGEKVSLTITGHSLGGALALLNAYEAATTFQDLPITVITFGAPRVGNKVFRDELDTLGVKTLRVAVMQDLVPKMPKEGVYTHVGVELKLNIHSSPYLKKGFNPLGFHSLETYLHLVDGFSSTMASFRADAKRDIALVNKPCDMLIDELRIPPCWFQWENKGLVRNQHGRWVMPKRDPEDVPSPNPEGHVQEQDQLYEKPEGSDKLYNCIVSKEIII